MLWYRRLIDDDHGAKTPHPERGSRTRPLGSAGAFSFLIAWLRSAARSRLPPFIPHWKLRLSLKKSVDIVGSCAGNTRFAESRVIFKMTHHRENLKPTVKAYAHLRFARVCMV
jgi:hypothetical protein